MLVNNFEHALRIKCPWMRFSQDTSRNSRDVDEDGFGLLWIGSEERMRVDRSEKQSILMLCAQHTLTLGDPIRRKTAHLVKFTHF